MKALMLMLVLLLGLASCGDPDNLQQYTLDVRTRPGAAPEPVPPVSSYVPEPYQPASQRSPFALPVLEVAATAPPAAAYCTAPAMRGPKQPLEHYALERLSMRGTLQQGGLITGLVSAPDGITHTVTPGDRMGLHHGEVRVVSRERIVLEEYLSDGRGCWNRRESTLLLVSKEQECAVCKQ
ncbi:pilus assembly protein PilP [Oceanimonas smirnovii]|uniref:Pilus assembly protein PilP n=1 Tax=Oceanimonas smirnovii TaxID=264574 RepID=A0ABW7NZA7_9GAMM